MILGVAGCVNDTIEELATVLKINPDLRSARGELDGLA
jgi:hypothetical protein